MYHPKDMVDLIADNVKKTGNPFGVTNKSINDWWRDASLKQNGTNGEYMLFTGMMYQMVPYIEEMTVQLEKWEDTGKQSLIKYAKYLPKFLMGLYLRTRTDSKIKKEYDNILLNIVKVLRRSDVDFYYNPELDYYSGILLYDMGDDEAFKDHAKLVARKLKENGVKKIVTVDPHTTYALKVLYPKYTGEEFEVKTYFELLDIDITQSKLYLEGEKSSENSRVTIHDPCFYGRYLELSDKPRRVLTDLGLTCDDIRRSQTFTDCCGGPAESLSPKLSNEVRSRRIEELSKSDSPLVTMCPICLANLRKSVEVEDLSNKIVNLLTEGPPLHMIEPLLLYWQIEKEGGEVSKERLREIGREYGQSGVLGSHFVGKEPFLVKKGVDKRALTPKAEKLVESYQDWLEKQEKSGQ
ncbi:MAG: (Fe-S)-binding protein [Halobacteriota archaeon]